MQSAKHQYNRQFKSFPACFLKSWLTLVKSIPTVRDPVKRLPWETLADKLPTSLLTTLRVFLFVCFARVCTKETLSLLNTFGVFFFLFFSHVTYLCYFQRSYWNSCEGSHTSRGRCSKVPGLSDLPQGKRQHQALTEPLVFSHNTITVEVRSLDMNIPRRVPAECPPSLSKSACPLHPGPHKVTEKQISSQCRALPHRGLPDILW